MVAQWDGVGGGTGLSWVLLTSNDTNRYLRFATSTNGSGVSFDLVSTTSLVLNAWNHVAIVRNGNTFQLYLNGTAATGGSTTSAITLYNATNSLTIGATSSGTQLATGYLSNTRVVKGTAVYTGAFTPPTAPITNEGSTSAASYPSTTNVNTSFASSATSLLLNFTNAGIYDATSNNDLETVGGAQISTAQSKWGGSSMYFDGTGDYLQSIPTPNLELGSGDYTVECWINISAAASNGGIVGIGPVGGLTNTTWSIEFNGSANTLSVYIYNANISTFIINGTTNVKTSTWIHVALTRSGNNTRLFINGTQEGSTYTSGYTISAGNNLYVGGGFYAPSTRTITGYIQDLRITKGYARYTANFTPPTSAFPTL